MTTSSEIGNDTEMQVSFNFSNYVKFLCRIVLNLTNRHVGFYVKRYIKGFMYANIMPECQVIHIAQLSRNSLACFYFKRNRCRNWLKINSALVRGKGFTKLIRLDFDASFSRKCLSSDHTNGENNRLCALFKQNRRLDIVYNKR